jgi:hypothetical protein
MLSHALLHCDAVFQMRCECFWGAGDVLEQPVVPHLIKVIGMAVEGDISRVPTVVAVILAMQRPVKVTPEMDYELQRFHLRRPIRFRAPLREPQGRTGWSGDR